MTSFFNDDTKQDYAYLSAFVDDLLNENEIDDDEFHEEYELNELSDEDKNSIIEYFKKYYDESESVINNFIRAINMQMCYVLQSEFNDAMERSSLFRELIVIVMANKELSKTEFDEFLNQHS